MEYSYFQLTNLWNLGNILRRHAPGMKSRSKQYILPASISPKLILKPKFLKVRFAPKLIPWKILLVYLHSLIKYYYLLEILFCKISHSMNGHSKSEYQFYTVDYTCLWFFGMFVEFNLIKTYQWTIGGFRKLQRYWCQEKPKCGGKSCQSDDQATSKYSQENEIIFYSGHDFKYSSTGRTFGGWWIFNLTSHYLRPNISDQYQSRSKFLSFQVR